MLKRKTALAVLLSLLCGIFASCGGTPAGEPGSDAPADDTTTEAETSSPYADNLPELDLGGEKVTFLYRAESIGEFYVEESNGEIVDDAVHDSMRAVEERLNAKAEIITRDCIADRSAYRDHIVQTIQAGDDVYDWCDLMADELRYIVTLGVLADLKDVDYLDFDQPWWAKSLAEEATIGGKLFSLVGDYSLSFLKNTFCVYFNRTVAENFGIKASDLYSCVLDGKWTLDKAIEVSKKAVADLNGDGNYGLEDSLGFVMHDRYHLCGFATSTDVRYYTKNKSGEWQYSFGTEHDIAAIEKINQLFVGTTGNLLNWGTRTNTSGAVSYADFTNQFANDKVLMITAQMDDAAADLRDMRNDYGLLPFPKYDEKQADYYTSSRTTHSTMVMPITCSNPDRAGAFMEALAASNHQSVTPTYFELALKTKYSRDNESAVMYDLIHNSRVLSFSYIYAQIVKTSPTETFLAGCRDPGDIASKLASIKEANVTSLAAYLKEVS